VTPERLHEVFREAAQRAGHRLPDELDVRYEMAPPWIQAVWEAVADGDDEVDAESSERIHELENDVRRLEIHAEDLAGEVGEAAEKVEALAETPAAELVEAARGCADELRSIAESLRRHDS